MISKKILSLSMVVVLGVAAAAQAGVVGTWSNTGNNYKFNVASDIGNITSLELSFAAAGGSTFQINFDENIFDSDGLIGGQADSFLLFPASVTSPGDTQAKTSTLLQAAFTGFPQFTAKDVAQLIVQGTAANPLASNIARDAARLGTAVVETIAGDPNSRQEFAILGGEIVTPAVNDLLLVNNILNGTVNGTVLGTDVATWSPTLTFLDYTPKYGAPNDPSFLPVVAATWNPANQAFNWDTTGSRRGDYRWQVSGINGELSDNGIITVEQHAVPEPATLALFGLALVGSVGAIRRRG